MTPWIVLIAAVLGATAPALAQYRVDPKSRGERIIAVVPMIGSGTVTDPRRPLFASTPWQPNPSGIDRFSYQPSDDGRYAIVEIVASDKAALVTTT